VYALQRRWSSAPALFLSVSNLDLHNIAKPHVTNGFTALIQQF
jgi:hypothetical protein